MSFFHPRLPGAPNTHHIFISNFFLMSFSFSLECHGLKPQARRPQKTPKACPRELIALGPSKTLIRPSASRHNSIQRPQPLPQTMAAATSQGHGHKQRQRPQGASLRPKIFQFLPESLRAAKQPRTLSLVTLNFLQRKEAASPRDSNEMFCYVRKQNWFSFRVAVLPVRELNFAQFYVVVAMLYMLTYYTFTYVHEPKVAI